MKVAIFSGMRQSKTLVAFLRSLFRNTRSCPLLLMLTLGMPGGVQVHAQDTFSIVAVDPVTGEVGSAGASCIGADNLKLFFPDSDADFLGDLLPGIGAINTQSYYLPENQLAARVQLLTELKPEALIDWLIANDAQGNASRRQYGLATIVDGKPFAAAYTGDSCLHERGHIVGTHYAIQGNILLRASMLKEMESAFLNEEGCLATKLMAALQAANFAGADARCLENGTSSLFAFLKVARPTDAYAHPAVRLYVAFNEDGVEPIDKLQEKLDRLTPCDD